MEESAVDLRQFKKLRQQVVDLKIKNIEFERRLSETKVTVDRLHTLVRDLLNELSDLPRRS